MTLIRDGLQSADLDVPVVLPTLNLDFANSQSLDERIAFTRGSIGTFVNKNGLIETAAANIPRFDYDPISGECRGLLIEESRTNLFTSSNDFSASGGNSSVLWNGSISANVITSPDGTTNASKFISNTSPLISHYPQKTVSSVAGNNYTFSVFVKAAEVTTIVLVCGNGSWYRAATFNLITGVATSNSQDVGVTAATTYTITPYPNGWYRCSVTSGSSDGTNCFTQIRASTGTKTNAIFGDGTSGFYVYGEQIETGAFPTSYIPTVASTVTRSADLASMTGTNFSSWYNQSEGSIVLSAIPYYSSSVNQFNRLISINNNSGSQNTVIQILTSNTSNSISNSFYTNSTYLGGNSKVINSGTKFKLASGFSSNNISICFDGSSFPSNKRPSFTLPTFDRMSIGSYNNNLICTMHISRLTYYPRALSPSQLQYLTQ